MTGRVGDLVGANIVPTYNADLARFLYSQHVFYIGLAVQHADRLFTAVYGAGINDEEKKFAGTAQMILLLSGYIEVPAEVIGEEHDWVRRLKDSLPPRGEVGAAPSSKPK